MFNDAAIIQELESLYGQVPAFGCRPGCYDCCGPVMATGLEWALIEDKRQGIGATCPYASSKGCAIYQQLVGWVERSGTQHGPIL
jgi:hypothetical protein